MWSLSHKNINYKGKESLRGLLEKLQWQMIFYKNYNALI